MAEISRLSKLKENLQSNQEAKETLEELNTLLETSSSNADVLQTVSIISPMLLFAYLTDEHSQELWDSACSALSKMLGAFPPSGIANMGQELELGLQHKYEGVRLLCLKLLGNGIGPPFHELLLKPTMFHLLAQLLGDESLECAQLSSKILEHLLTHPDSFSIITSTSLREGFLLDLNGLVAKGDIVRFRVYDLVTRLSNKGGDLFAFVRDTGYIEKLISELESDDVLIKLNSLELLLSLSETPQGLGIVHSADVLKKLHSLLLLMSSDPLASVLVPGILKFFGSYCQLEAISPLDICLKYPSFLQAVCDAIGFPDDATIWGMAIDTLCLFGSTIKGRLALCQSDIDINKCIMRLGELVSHPQLDVKVRTLKGLANIFSCDEGPAHDTSVTLSHRWFKLAGIGLVATVTTMMKQPFPDLHMAGLLFLESLSKWKWGQIEMRDSPGFVEFLLDRRTEVDKEGKEMKFNIIKQLSLSPHTEEVFGSPVLLSLKKYVLEGPFYIKIETVVAVEER